MYNGIGLPTARGSGTNAYVTRNFAVVRKYEKINDRGNNKSDSANRKPNKDILDHARKRKIEVKCAEYSEVLETQGLTQEEIEIQLESYRRLLLTNEENKQKSDNLKCRDIDQGTHELAEANIQKNNLLRQAFGLSEDFVDGSSFEKQQFGASSKAVDQKTYELVRTSDSSLDEMKTSKVKVRRNKMDKKLRKKKIDKKKNEYKLSKLKKSKKTKKNKKSEAPFESKSCIDSDDDEKDQSNESIKKSSVKNKKKKSESSKESEKIAKLKKEKKRKSKKLRRSTPSNSSDSEPNSSTHSLKVTRKRKEKRDISSEQYNMEEYTKKLENEILSNTPANKSSPGVKCKESSKKQEEENNYRDYSDDKNISTSSRSIDRSKVSEQKKYYLVYKEENTESLKHSWKICQFEKTEPKEKCKDKISKNHPGEEFDIEPRSQSIDRRRSRSRSLSKRKSKKSHKKEISPSDRKKHKNSRKRDSKREHRRSSSVDNNTQRKSHRYRSRSHSTPRKRRK